jgi:exonuclease SbcC
MIKFLHTADIHADKKRKDDVIRLLDIFINEVEEKQIDAVLIAGDFWHHAVVNNTPFAQINEKMAQLISKVPVYMCYGTPHHEVANSLEVFKLLGAHVADSPTLWTFDKNGEKIDILAIPEPRKSLLLGKNTVETESNISKYFDGAVDVKSRNSLIVMFHGEVTGAKYPNGKEAISDTRLAAKRLEKLNPLYVACGHIHIPQDVNNFHYSGSPIPLDFGELHKPSYNLVIIEDGKCDFEKVLLPFPQNRVVDCTLKTFEGVCKMNLKGLNVKICLTLTPEERRNFNTLAQTKIAEESTGAEFVKIAIKTESVDAVRSKEIVKTTSIKDKLKIWAKVNEIKLSDDVIKKAEDLQNNMLIKYSFPSHSFELISLSLRGAKGIKSKEEIFVDFSKYDDGILAVIGPNGSGKSTLIEFASPYPCLLTRSGALRSHFYLKDSHRIIIYRDETGKLYRLSTFLAAHVESGLVKYYAETSNDNGETWQTVKDCDGNLDTYKTYVEETFGSLSVYLRTAFFTRGKVKGISDIASATKGERIELLSELFGTDNLSTLHDMTKECIKDLEKKQEMYSGCEDQVTDLEEQIARQLNNEVRLTRELEEVKTELQAIENEIKDTKEREEEFAKQYAKGGNLIQMKADAENRFVELQTHLDNLKEHKRKNDYYKMNKDKILEYKKVYEESRPMYKEILSINDKLNEQSELVLTLTEECNNLKSQYEAEERKLSSADDRIKRAKEGTFEIGDTCPTCGAKLSDKKKKDLLKALDHVNSEIESLVDWKEHLVVIVKDAKKAYTDSKNKLKKADEKRKELKSEYDEKNGLYVSTQAFLDLNEEYAAYTDYAEVTNLESDIERIEKDLRTTEDFLKSLSGIDTVDFKAELDELEAKRKEAEDTRLRTSVDLATTQSIIKQSGEALAEAKKKVDEVKVIAKDLADYYILEKAFANSGIQSLELEAAIPEVASLTNSILQSSYGDKFQVTFSTLRQGKTKIVDDFCIDVANSETGWTTPIELLSAGEKIWVIQSLYFAFSIIRMQRTGFNFQVRFLDESDGELDGEKKLEYVNMVKSTHALGHARLTCLVTHSQELKEILPQTLQM